MKNPLPFLTSGAFCPDSLLTPSPNLTSDLWASSGPNIPGAKAYTSLW
ncbi:hypothetical protein ACFPMF_23895 [Larkinella bovis]|uniref:Uncharacterized protein n=1 Tax=Larkinella bovis TaxID=683041 RepID=A0ABW0II05_9BACT